MKIKFILLLFLFLFLSACSTNKNKTTYTEHNNIKVIYFSCTNNTEKVANKISNYLNCSIEEILPLQPYTDADLNYNNNSSRANIEQNDINARPEIQNTIDLTDIDTIFLGYPIWWGKLPKIIYTFLETYDLNSYTIIPFCTSGGSGIQTSIEEIKQCEPNAEVLQGKRFSSNAKETDIETFIDTLKI